MNTTIFTTIRHDLHNHYAHAVDGATIDRLLRETYAAHDQTATIRDFLPILVERETREKIENLYTESSLFPTPRRSIVFVSRGNRALADTAAAIANRLGGPALTAYSAPTHPENVHDVQLETVAREQDLDLQGTELHRASERTLDAVDAAVYLTTDESHDINARHEFTWDFSRTDGMTPEEVRELADDLGARVQALLQGLRTPLATGAALAA